MPRLEHKQPVRAILVIGCLLIALGGCSGELYPEAPTPTPTPSRSTSPGTIPGTTWQTLSDQIQTTSTALGTLTFTPLVRSDDPGRIQFVLTLDRTNSTDPVAGRSLSGSLDLQPRNGSSTRLSMVPSGASGMSVETRLTTGQTVSILARLNVDGITISGSFTFEVL